jgi:gamma-glutamyl phosphate reductase
MELQLLIEKLRKNQKEYLSATILPIELLEKIKKNIINNFDIISKAYKIDTENIELLQNRIIAQFDIGEVPTSDTFKNQFGKVTNMYSPYGVLGVISTCDIYNILKIMVLAIATRNAVIIDVTKNIGTIFLLKNEFNNVLNEFNLPNLIEIYNHDEDINMEESFELDALIYIGKRADAERIKIGFDKSVIFSGCGNYELYVEDNLGSKLIEEAKHLPGVNIYSSDSSVGQYVSSLEEAIIRINEMGNEYSASIITKSRDSAKIFVSQIKSRNVFVNALPTLIDNALDIDTLDLMYKKSILIYE